MSIHAAVNMQPFCKYVQEPELESDSDVDNNDVSSAKKSAGNEPLRPL